MFQVLVSSSVHMYLLLLGAVMLLRVTWKLERRRGKQPSLEFDVRYITASSVNVFPSLSLCINSFSRKI